MDSGRSPATPSHVGGQGSRPQRTPHSQTRNRSDSGPNIRSPGPGGLARINQSPGPGSLSTHFVTPKRRELLSPQASQLASTASPHSVSASPMRQVTGGEREKRSPAPVRSPRSPISMRVRTLFSGIPLFPRFSLIEEVGQGTFSKVFLAEDTLKVHPPLALKVLIPTSKPSRILSEVACMKAARGHPNVVNLVGMWRLQGDVILAMTPCLNSYKFVDLFDTIDVEEVKLYIANLLSALEHIHKVGIIHRDVKPGNFLYDRKKKKFALVDFGLAQWESEYSHEMEKGCKRKPESPAGEVPSKKPRPPLTESTSKLNCSRSPKARLLREHHSPGLRRSPRKMINLSDALGAGEKKAESKKAPLLPNIPVQHVNLNALADVSKRLNSTIGSSEKKSASSASTPNINLRAVADIPQKKLNFSVNGSSGKKSASTAPVRCSPRKLSMATKGGISTLKIANNSIISPDLGTPSPTTMSRTPSLSHLDPSQASQTTDMTGRTPLLLASVTPAPSPLPNLPDVSITISPRPSHVTCTCPGALTVCDICLAHPQLHVHRGGTPGFRPPEVLLKVKEQTGAVDIWAAGIMLLSILSRYVKGHEAYISHTHMTHSLRSYPFFRAPDDMTALAEMITLFGTEPMDYVANR